MPQPCSQCDQPDMSLLRLVLIGEILLANETWLLRLVDVLQQSGLMHFAEEPTALPVRRHKGMLHPFQRPDAGNP
jgi:hypothetical protein